MKKIRVKIVDTPLKGGDAVRGVGFYTKNLTDALKKNDSVELVEKNYELIHYPFFNPFSVTLPFNEKAKVAVTIHDLIPLLYPKHYPPGLWGNIKFLIQKILLAKVNAIFTVSETSKKDIVRFLGIPTDKIFVTYEAPGEIFQPFTNHHSLITVREEYRLPEHFVLYVGDINYNKNIVGLVEACKLAKIPLVIVGKQAKDLEKMNLSHLELSHLTVHRSLITNHSLRLGFVPDTDLVKIFNLASLYCQPSFYEGFGLPVVQAFACGVPVVAARTQALVEIAEDSALFVNPKDSKDMAAGILKVLGDGELRNDLVKKGNIRVREFSWAKTAQRTVAGYKKVVGR